VSLIYADTSALARAYLEDEQEHGILRDSLLEGTDPVVTSELARVELAGAIRAAAAAGRLRRPEDVLARIDVDLGEPGPVSLLGLRPGTVIPAAYRLALEHRLRTLDAIHLAVALEECPAIAGDDDVLFVTRDRDQATAAASLGFAVG
jgi:predicted nucleic acid-binding protein